MADILDSGFNVPFWKVGAMDEEQPGKTSRKERRLSRRTDLAEFFKNSFNLIIIQFIFGD